MREKEKGTKKEKTEIERKLIKLDGIYEYINNT